MNNEVKNTLKEIRTKQKKMTRTAIVRIIDKKNDPAFSTILVDMFVAFYREGKVDTAGWEDLT